MPDRGRVSARDAARCRTCGRVLTKDEIAVTRKLINRGAKEFQCVDCLAAFFEVSPEDIRERIDYFRSTGCTLFETETGDGSLSPSNLQV